MQDLMELCVMSCGQVLRANALKIFVACLFETFEIIQTIVLVSGQPFRTHQFDNGIEIGTFVAERKNRRGLRWRQ